VALRRRDGKRKFNMNNFMLMEKILCGDKTQGRTYRDIMDDKTSSLKEKGWKVRKDSYRVDDDLLVYRCTLHCKSSNRLYLLNNRTDVKGFKEKVGENLGTQPSKEELQAEFKKCILRYDHLKRLNMNGLLQMITLLTRERVPSGS